jgi:ketosteroid isomerase-like protein
MKQFINLCALSILFTACSSNVDANKKMAGDFLDLALSANPLDAQELTHPEFKFVFMGNTEISNIPYDRDAYFDYWLPEVVGKLLPTGITLTTTDMIADDDGVAVIMEGDAQGINGEYDNKYVFVYKFKDGKIFSIHEYNSDLLVATRLYKNKLVPSD